MKSNKTDRGKIVIYSSKKEGINVEVHLKGETIWLRQDEIARLYGKERSVITKHINKIFADNEIDKKGNVQNLHIPNSDKPVAFYSLDVILAVGYRTNSQRAVHFRKWATKILKNYLVKGYALNQKRLQQANSQLRELQNTITFLNDKVSRQLLPGQEQEILNLLASYSKTLTLLENYDREKLILAGKTKDEYTLKYEEALWVISAIKKELIQKNEAGDLFGKDEEGRLKGIIGNIYQTFNGRELYGSLEEKAAHLLYFIIKDHPFVDGNKRIASFLFVFYLDRNNFLYRKTGEKKINDNTLTALSLLIAVSDASEKDKIIRIITNLLAI